LAIIINNKQKLACTFGNLEPSTIVIKQNVTYEQNILSIIINFNGKVLIIIDCDISNEYY
jgi:hypothetical protein